MTPGEDWTYDELVEQTIRSAPYPVAKESLTLEMLFMTAIGFDWTQDGLYICEKGCGFTYDHECDYGGWHDPEDSLEIKRREK